MRMSLILRNGSDDEDDEGARQKKKRRETNTIISRAMPLAWLITF